MRQFLDFEAAGRHSYLATDAVEYISPNLNNGGCTITTKSGRQYEVHKSALEVVMEILRTEKETT